MLERLFGFLSSRRRRTLLAERLLVSVEQLGSMVFDHKLIAQLGVGRKLAIKLACHLALKERIHMLTDPRGRVVLMSNVEYERYTERRANGEPEAEIHVRGGFKSMVVKEFDPDAAAPSFADAACMAPVKALPLPASGEDSSIMLFSRPPLLGNEMDSEWFTIDNSGEKQNSGSAKSASERQSLPERKREPWISADISRQDGE